MATQLADPPAGTPPEPPPPAGPADAPFAGTAPAMLWRTCANCGAQIHSTQDWCLQCGAVAPDGLAATTPRWRSGMTIAVAVVLLVAGAAIASYAAVHRSHSKRPPATATTVAQAPGATTTPAAAPTGAAAAATAAAGTAAAGKATTPSIGAPVTIKPQLPLGRSKPPKIPISAATPKSAGTTGTPSSATTPTTPAKTTPAKTTPAKTAPNSTTKVSAQAAEPILLDTNAAATYNPYDYPANAFGDPSLAIDGEVSTAWTAQVNPAVAPRMAEGLVINLNSGQKLASLLLVTVTPGMTVQVYGARGDTVPASITDPGWAQLSPSLVVKKPNTRIKLLDTAKAFHFVALWISQAPQSSVGTPQAPGHVSVNEIELLPAKSS